MRSILLILVFVFTGFLNAQTLSPISLEQLVNTDLATDQYNSNIAADESGGYLITWTTSYSSGLIQGRFYNSSHVAISNEISINSASSESPKLKYWGNGTYIISYIESSNDVLKFRTIDAAGNVGAAVTVLSNVLEFDFDVKGDSLAFLYTITNSFPQMYLRSYSLSTNNWINQQLLVSEDASERYYEPNIVFHPSGRLTAIYQFYINVSGCCTYDRRIMRKTFNSSFIAEIPEYALWSVNAEQYVGDDLHAEGNNSGEVIITTTHGTTSSSRFMRMWLLDAQGGFIANNVTLLSSGGNDWYDNVQGELYDNGNFVIVKSIRTGGFTNPNGNEAYVIYGYDYNQSNSGILQMNSTNAGDQEFCTVAKLANGGFVAAWAGNGFQGDDQGIYSRAYNAVAFPGFSITNTGNNQVNEAGGTLTLNVSLTTQPTGNVTVNVLSSNTSEGTLSTNVLNFTPSNWNVVQNLVVTGIDDLIDDGNINFTVTFSTTSSADVTYAALNSTVYNLTNLDNDATITSPQDQQVCKSAGLSGVNFIVANEGSPITSITATSSNQNVVENADIVLNNNGNGTYEVEISNLSNNQVGVATITITATDGLFNYVGDFNVTTTSIDLTLLATDTEICSGESVTLLALGSGTITWNNGVQNNVAFSPQQTTVYTASGDDGSGCSSSETIEIVVTPTPTIPTITPFANNLVSSSSNGNQWYLDGELIDGANSQLFTPEANGNYTVVVSQGACSSSSESYLYDAIITSINKDFSVFAIYPNPASEYVHLTGILPQTEISISTITGKLVDRVVSLDNKQTMNISNLLPGVYLLSISNDQIRQTTKLVVN
jgi:Secretion system C-terminal sorting domain